MLLFKKRAPLTPPESKSPGRGGQISGQDSDSDDSIESVNSRLYRRITAAAGATSNQQTTSQSTSKSSGGGDKSPKTCKSPEAKKTPFSNPDQELRLTLRNVSNLSKSSKNKKFQGGENLRVAVASARGLNPRGVWQNPARETPR